MSHITRLPFAIRLLLAAMLFTTGLALPLTALATPASATATSGFTATQAIRLVDTRVAQRGRTLGAGRTLQVKLPSQVPANAKAVALNVTATGASTSTYLTVWPKGVARPTTSNVNVAIGDTRANAVIVTMGKDRSVSIFNGHGTVDVLVDLTGWFTSGFEPMTPTRVMDTRIGLGAASLGPGTTRRVAVTGTTGVPRTAAAVVVNLTATDATQVSYLTAMASGRPRPQSSNLNIVPGVTTANMAVVPLGTDGRIAVYNESGRTDVLVDVLGWFHNGQLEVGAPVRVLDTRIDACVVRLSTGETRSIRVTERTDVGAAVLNVTATGAWGPSYVTVWPTGTSRPNTSTINVTGEQSVANAAVVGLGTAGQVSLYNGGAPVDVIVDLLALFPGTTPAVTVPPCEPTETVLTGSVASQYVVGARGVNAVGLDRVAVWVCDVPADSRDPFYSQSPDRVAMDPAAVAAWANANVSPYFEHVSRGRYRVRFEVGGRIALPVDTRFGPSECKDQALANTTRPFTNVLATDTFGRGGLFGFAGPGMMRNDADLNAGPLTGDAMNWGRGMYVSPRSVDTSGRFGRPPLVAHELGHTLSWPHSHLSSDDEYDNPIDLMSGAGRSKRIPNTLAFNRLASGWIDDAEVVVHHGRTTRATLSAPLTAGSQLLIAPTTSDPRVLVTLEARPAVGADADQKTSGVAVHVIDQRPGGCRAYGGEKGCFGLGRRHRQAMGSPYSEGHVLQVGQRATVDGLNIVVVAARGTGFDVQVTGSYTPSHGPEAPSHRH